MCSVAAGHLYNIWRPDTFEESEVYSCIEVDAEGLIIVPYTCVTGSMFWRMAHCW